MFQSADRGPSGALGLWGVAMLLLMVWPSVARGSAPEFGRPVTLQSEVLGESELIQEFIMTPFGFAGLLEVEDEPGTTLFVLDDPENEAPEILAEFVTPPPPIPPPLGGSSVQDVSAAWIDLDRVPRYALGTRVRWSSLHPCIPGYGGEDRTRIGGRIVYIHTYSKSYPACGQTGSSSERTTYYNGYALNARGGLDSVVPCGISEQFPDESSSQFFPCLRIGSRGIHTLLGSRFPASDLEGYGESGLRWPSPYLLDWWDEDSFVLTSVEELLETSWVTGIHIDPLSASNPRYAVITRSPSIHPFEIHYLFRRGGEWQSQLVHTVEEPCFPERVRAGRDADRPVVSWMETDDATGLRYARYAAVLETEFGVGDYWAIR